MLQTSKAWTFDRNDALHTLKVFGWSLAASIIALVISLIPDIHFPVEYAFIVPVVNALLVGAQRLVQAKQQ